MCLQVAWGVFWDWNGNNDIAVLKIMDCASLTPGASCVAVHTPVQTAPFYGGQAPA